jgi:hypothetical protein
VNKARSLVVSGLTLAAAACLVSYLVAARSATTAGLPLDDSFIHLQFARSIAAGDGLAFRTGRLVSGSTAPLWTAVLSLLFALPGPLLLWVNVLGAALYAAGAAATWALARELDLSPALAAGVTLLYLLTDAMVWSALSGMEVGLFVALSVAATALHLRERRAASPGRPSLALALFGLASLARPEGFLLLVLAVVDRLLFPAPGNDRRKAGPSPVGAGGALAGIAIGALCAALVIAAFLLFSLTVSGSPLPTTYAVKTDGPRSLLPSGLYLLRVVGVMFRPHPLPVLLALGGALCLLERLRTPRDRGLLPALWVAGLPLAYSLYDSPEAPMMVGNFGRYYFPLIPFVLVLGALALEQPLARLRAAPALWRAAAAMVLAAALLVPPVSTLAMGRERYAANVRNVNDSDVAMSIWIRDHLPPAAVIAAQDVGAIGFLTPNPLIDLTGITTPEILPSIERAAGASGGRAGLVRFLEQRRPDYLMLFADSYPGFLDEVGGQVVRRLRVERNVTMAGADLVLARSSWAVLGEGGAQAK